MSLNIIKMAVDKLKTILIDMYPEAVFIPNYLERNNDNFLMETHDDLVVHIWNPESNIIRICDPEIKSNHETTYESNHRGFINFNLANPNFFDSVVNSIKTKMVQVHIEYEEEML